MRLKPWQFLFLLAAVLVLFTFGITRFRHRLVQHGADLVRLLPEERDATLFYVDVALLRTSHVLGLISADKAEDSDYRSFVQATGFDYARDIDALAGMVSANATDFLVEGRFDWDRFENYARDHGGSCGDICSVPTSTAGKWASFRLLQPDVLAMSISADKQSVNRIGHVGKPSRHVPSDPLWVTWPGSALTQTNGWPVPAQMLATALHGAERVTFAAGLHDGGLRLEMKARFPNAHAAQIARNQLEIDTKMLNLELAREHQKPNPSDLSGLLTSGAFQLVGGDVIGDWSIDRQLLQSLEVE